MGVVGEGEADAGDGDGFTEIEGVWEVSGGEVEAQAEGLWFGGFDLCDGLDEACEHVFEDTWNGVWGRGQPGRRRFVGNVVVSADRAGAGWGSSLTLGGGGSILAGRVG